MNRDSKGRFCKAEPNRNYRLRKDLTKMVNGRTLYRIEATRDIARFGVRKGELGGWIESYENLSGDAKVSGDAWVSGEVLKSENDCINIIGEKYNITILPNSILIGCQYHTRAEWFRFSDRKILTMDGKDGLRWWRTWKQILRAICEAGKERKGAEK